MQNNKNKARVQQSNEGKSQQFLEGQVFPTFAQGDATHAGDQETKKGTP